MASTVDNLWHSQIESDHSLFVIEDYCPAALVGQLMEIASNQNIGKEDNLIKFATDTSFSISILHGKKVVDLCSQNLLNVDSILKLPEPVKFILIDLNPQQLKASVLGSERSTCPDPVPFIFEEDTLKYICESWYSINQTIKEVVQKERLILINEKQLNDLTRGKQNNAGRCDENNVL